MSWPTRPITSPAAPCRRRIRARPRATIEGEADLVAWVRFCLAMVRPKGTVTFIHRADRVDALIGADRRPGRRSRDLSAVAGRGPARRAASWCAPASRSRRRRGSPPGWCCIGRTGGRPIAPRACCARDGGSSSEPRPRPGPWPCRVPLPISDPMSIRDHLDIERLWRRGPVVAGAALRGRHHAAGAAQRHLARQPWQGDRAGVQSARRGRRRDRRQFARRLAGAVGAALPPHPPARR